MSYHHPKTAEAYNVLSKYWKDKTDITEDAVYYSHSATQNRCGKCWLRRHQCYCNIAEDRIQYYKTNFSENISNCQIIMYYHYQEIGRSANTAHVFELICPHICSTLLYGDVEHESILFNEMRKEYELGILRTCVLYPSSDAMNIKDWIDKYSDPELLSTQRKSFHRSSNIGDDHSEGSNNALEDINYFINMKFRIIALDGTYKQVKLKIKT